MSVIDTPISCSACLITYANKYSLERHIKKSKLCSMIRDLKRDNENYEGYIDELTNENEDYKTQIEKYKEREETVRRKREFSKLKKQLISKLEPITSDEILDSNDSLTLKITNNGAQGYADWLLSYFEDKTFCVDGSRKKIVWKNEEDFNIVNDIGCKYLLNKVFNDDATHKLIKLLKQENKLLQQQQYKYNEKEYLFLLSRNSERRSNVYEITKSSNFSNIITKLFISGLKTINLKE